MIRGSRNQQATVVGVSPMSSAPAGPSHQVEEYWTAAVKGTRLLKFGRRGNPHMHFFRLSEDNNALQWEARNHRVRRIPLSSVHKVIKGQHTEVFIKSRSKAYRTMVDQSFSLVYTSRNEERTLDLVCKDAEEFDLWYNGLRLITEHFRKKGGGVVLGFPDQMFGTPAPKHTPPGDCYIWGSFPERKGVGSEHTAVSSPQLVPASQKLDIVQVACGPQHYSAVSRSGHLYTWGTGSLGRLGLGTLQHVATPTAVSGLNDMSGVKSTSCGDCSTAAILSDGSLYTWGCGLSGQLGHNNLSTQYLPHQIEQGLQGIVIVEVSCGPYHSAACSDSGQLFTWGDGLCGKLGHGDWQSCLQPRPLDALEAEGKVIGVSCGWWHTAAVVELSTTPKSVGLYTWGGEFSWEGDHNKGCLGNGTTSGTAVPCKVEGDLALRNVKQVACGLNLTVTLTTDGLVYQMGTTGAGAAHVEWEGARKPTRVEGRLKGCFADKVACGCRHVCVVATPIFSGRIDETRRSSYLFMWGSGKNGQLGNGDKDDQSSPQLVEKLRQRRIEDISCGGDYTLAVCRYDPRVAAAAFVPHPDFTSTGAHTGIGKKSGQNGGPASAASGPVTSVFGALKQKSVKHRRNEGSNVGSDVSLPRPPPKVIGVHNSARIRMERQKISETTFLAPLVSGGQSSGEQMMANDISENGEDCRGDDESPRSVDPSSGMLVTPRRDTAPAEFRGPFAGHDSSPNHRLHLSADTAYHPEHGYLETGTSGSRALRDSGHLEGSEYPQAQDFEEGESVVSGVLSDPTNNGRHGYSHYKDGATSSEASLTTTEGIGRSHNDSDDETIDSRSNTRSFSNMDIPGLDHPISNALNTQEPADPLHLHSASISMLDLASTRGSQVWPRSQQLRSAARLRSRQKVLQQVLSLTESWTAGDLQLHSQGPCPEQMVMESARAPRLWETGNNTIRENLAQSGSQTTRSFLGSKVHFEECQQVPTGSSSPPLQQSAHNVTDSAVELHQPDARQVMQLPGHTARFRPESLPRLSLDRGLSVPVAQSLPIATAREEVMNKAAEYEHMRQQLQRYAEGLQAAQATLDRAAEEQGREANRLGMDITKVHDMLKPSSSEGTSGPGGATTPEAMASLVGIVQKATKLVGTRPVNNGQKGSAQGQDNELARENEEMRVLLHSLSSLMSDMGSALKISSAPEQTANNVLSTPDPEPSATDEESLQSSVVKKIKSLDLGTVANATRSNTSSQAMNMRMEQVDEGVSVIFQTAENVTKIKKIRFSKRLFTAEHAQEWWEENQSRLVRDYGLVPGHMLGENNPARTGDSEAGDGGLNEAISWLGSGATTTDRDSLPSFDDSMRRGTRYRAPQTNDTPLDSTLAESDNLSQRLANLKKEGAEG